MDIRCDVDRDIMIPPFASMMFNLTEMGTSGQETPTLSNVKLPFSLDPVFGHYLPGLGSNYRPSAGWADRIG